MGVLAAVSTDGEALHLLGLLIVILCICGAAWRAYLRDIVGTVLLIVVAIFAGALLL